ncbi:MAG: hypothetical protein QOI24_1385 [Acidobacteriota bacterium]|jgi:uncharacterized protein involved in type VI secretion and phage assembly|nr:hypothetical protein [Acidobacteriota bacterium]
MSDRFFGKYRGSVVNNLDPMRIGRILASVPDVGTGIPTSWAMPCVPITGRKAGTWFVPQVGAAVWIEFEQGDADYPIWSGCFWGSSSEVPGAVQKGNPASPSIVLQTALQNQIVMHDVPGPTGGIILKVASGASIEINDLGITISNGKGASIVLQGPSVTINKGALTVI